MKKRYKVYLSRFDYGDKMTMVVKAITPEIAGICAMDKMSRHHDQNEWYVQDVKEYC